MNGANGGKVILRLVASGEEGAEYAGELSAESGAWTVTARVNDDGGVVFEHASDTPGWLVATARATLRAAWRSTKAGAPWPRRLSRWRAASEDERAKP